jgi:hypothetical protein
MPLYFFTIEDGERIPGEQGYEFPDDDTARLQAERISRDLSKNRPAGRNWVITVADETGRTVAEVPTTWQDY